MNTIDGFNMWWRLKNRTWISKREKAMIPPRRLWVTPEDSFIHFLRWGYEYRSYLTLLCKLRPTDKVLELGCHHGRTAMGLVDYLKPPGLYEGLDIQKAQVKWAKACFDNHVFNFTCVDIYNSRYNPQGQILAGDFVFPYGNNHFNVVYAASVFTHLAPSSVKHFLQEISRVSKPKGKILLSFCLLDFYKGQGTTISRIYEANYGYMHIKGVKIKNPYSPEDLIFYRGNIINQFCKKANLKIIKIIPGYWSNLRKYAVNEQDLLLIEKC